VDGRNGNLWLFDYALVAIKHGHFTASLRAANNRCNPGWNKGAYTSFARRVIPIRANALSDRDDFISELCVIDTKLTKAKVHRPAGGLGCRSQLFVDALKHARDVKAIR
jgi:hypothetical protein